jgi:hypothetical protein
MIGIRLVQSDFALTFYGSRKEWAIRILVVENIGLCNLKLHSQAVEAMKNGRKACQSMEILLLWTLHLPPVQVETARAVTKASH